ncbi:hypothetical protein AKO1_011204 [Acrasis kona]|uniref:Enhancer of polycomb-like protein n=1 Tax=Acrasis kona TaxID=1008807 RepID=A0AAW2YWJ6_9EUKA
MSHRINFRQRKIDVKKPLPIIIPTLTQEEMVQYSGLDAETIREFRALQAEQKDKAGQDEDTFELEEEDSGGTGGNTSHRTGKSSSRAIRMPTREAATTEIVDIPVPVVIVHEETRRAVDNSHPFKLPRHYIRYMGKSYEKQLQQIDYDLDEFDEEWLEEHARSIKKQDDAISESDFEFLIDRFERVTHFQKSLPTLQEMTEANPDVKESCSDKTLRKVYDYWQNRRRSRMYPNDVDLYQNIGKPLLMDFELAPDMDDTNPYVAFRPREREKPGRKQRKNDKEAFLKLTQLRNELDRLRDLTKLTCDRERLKLDYYRVTAQILAAQSRSISSIKIRKRVEDGHVWRRDRSAASNNDIENIRKKRRVIVEESDSERTEESEDEQVDQDALDDAVVEQPGRREFDMHDFTSVCMERKEPVFSFLIKVEKRKPVEGLDEMIQSKCEDLYSTSCRMSRCGRIAIDFDPLGCEDNVNDEYRQTFADDDDFSGLEEPVDGVG